MPGDSRQTETTRRRRQCGAPHRTNDIDAGKRRRTLEGLPDPRPLTNFFVRREALLIRVEVRDLSPLTLSQQGGEAGGSLSREAPGRVGAAPTKPGRASTARWCGSGEHGGEEYARNQLYYVS